MKPSQYDQIGPAYLKAQGEFYSANKDETRDFIRGNLPRSRYLLDLGCGDGRDMENYEKIGYVTTGIDDSIFMANQARARLKDTAVFHGTIENMPFQDSLFDVATSRFSLHYLPSLDRAYAEINRVLAPDGLLIAVASHPLTDFVQQRNGVYGERQIITHELFGRGIKVKSFTHTMSDFFSPEFFKLFNLEKFHEGKQHDDATEANLPGFMGFVARAKK